jgi:hypothetical protein
MFGGMTLNAYVQPDADILVIDVAGGDPARPQGAVIRLLAHKLARWTFSRVFRMSASDPAAFCC